jgi:hypothetical protein
MQAIKENSVPGHISLDCEGEKCQTAIKSNVTEDADEESFEVEAVLARRTQQGKTKYLLKWKNFSE